MSGHNECNCCPECQAELAFARSENADLRRKLQAEREYQLTRGSLICAIESLDRKVRWQEDDLKKAKREIVSLRKDESRNELAELRGKVAAQFVSLKYLYQQCRKHGILDKLEDGEEIAVITDEGLKMLEMPDDLNE